LAISVRYGVPKWKALRYKQWKKSKDKIKNLLLSAHFSFLLYLYRFFKNKIR
jgi:hypothetical protein